MVSYRDFKLNIVAFLLFRVMEIQRICEVTATPISCFWEQRCSVSWMLMRSEGASLSEKEASNGGSNNKRI